MTTSQPPVVAPQQPYSYKTITDLQLDDNIRALIFSPPYAGKSALLMTFPEPTIADFDGQGVKVARSPYMRQFAKNFKPGELQYETFVDKKDKYGMPLGNPEAFWKSIEWINKVITTPRKTIGIDSLSSMSKSAALAAIQVAGRRKRSQTWAHMNEDHMLLATQADFGAEMSAVEQLLDQLMNIQGRNIIVLAHERTETSDSGAVVSRSPLITGDRLRAKIGQWFDEVWYLDTQPNGTRILRCQPYGVLKGVGSRLGMPAQIENPTYDKIIQAMKGERK